MTTWFKILNEKENPTSQGVEQAIEELKAQREATAQALEATRQEHRALMLKKLAGHKAAALEKTAMSMREGEEKISVIDETLEKLQAKLVAVRRSETKARVEQIGKEIGETIAETEALQEQAAKHLVSAAILLSQADGGDPWFAIIDLSLDKVRRFKGFTEGIEEEKTKIDGSCYNKQLRLSEERNRLQKSLRTA